ncbi:MAG: hypothetical protein IPJ65_35205 [Archangiaceae bacterium]|nr:hypothetical protein [Archangiaceae bacterium]
MIIVPDSVSGTRHRKHETKAFTVATVNDDFVHPKTSNLPGIDADIVLAQETKWENAAARLGKKYNTHQNTTRVDKSGTTVAFKDEDRFKGKGSGYELGVTAHGRKMETRWINYTDVEVDGVKVRMASVHRPPLRFKALWPEFDRHLAQFAKETRQEGLPLIIGMDSNTHQPHVMEKLTGLTWRSVPGSIDGFLVSKEVRVDHLHRLAKNTSDHNPVVGKFHVRGR